LLRQCVRTGIGRAKKPVQSKLSAILFFNDRFRGNDRNALHGSGMLIAACCIKEISHEASC